MDYPCHLLLLNKILELKKSNTIFIYYLKCLSNIDRKKSLPDITLNTNLIDKSFRLVPYRFDKTRHTQP